MQAVLSAARVSITIAFFLYASWNDFKTREVSNTVWIVFAPVAFSLAFVETFLFGSWRLPLYGMCIGITTVFAVLLFYGGGFGGADAKALMCLALALPFQIDGPFNLPFGGTSLISQAFFPITVFSNSVVLAGTAAIYMLLRNLLQRTSTEIRLFEGELRNESIIKKLLVCATGYRIPVQKLKAKWHLYPLEDLDEVGDQLGRRLLLFPKDESREATVARLEKAVEAGRIPNAVWATPGLPMLIFITIGLLTTILVGDIIWICVSLLLG